MKLFKKNILTIASVFLIMLVIVSCQNNEDSLIDDRNEFNKAKEELIIQNRTSIGNCSELNDIYTNSQVTAANRFKSSFDTYTNCGNSVTPYTGSCCPAKTIYFKTRRRIF